MAVFKDPRFTRRFFTKFRGGLSVPEIMIAATVMLIFVLAMGGKIFTILIGFVVGVAVAWQTRRFPTQFRDFRVWLGQAFMFVTGRAHPLAQRRLMSGRLRVPPGPRVHGGIVQVLGREANQHGKGTRQKQRRRSRSPSKASGRRPRPDR